jgi:type I restriction-modification system DNA methylase subunit
VSQQFPKAHLFPYNFEFQFAKDKKALLRDGFPIDEAFDAEAFDLVIGSPPYGAHKSPYAYLFEQDVQVRAEGFFIYLALQRLKPGALLVFVINSLWLLNGEKYNAQKEKIAAIADLIDAYRLPNNIFKGENRDTSIATDIVIFKKR